jgi:hypothetical protein
MQLRFMAALLLFTSTTLAQPVITSISPASGPVAGGTGVTIHGSGFSNLCIFCSPPIANPRVSFGATYSNDTRFIDANTIQAVTPPLLPTTMPVVVTILDGSAPSNANVTFTSEGDPMTGFDPILLPVHLHPIFGAFGSEFHTVTFLSDKGDHPYGSRILPVYGIDLSCTLIDPPRGPLDPLSITDSQTEILFGNCSPSTGRLLYVVKGEGKSLAANIRVTDVTKQATSNGVEIPAVHIEGFSEERLVFMGVPADSRFRSKLRLYTLSRAAMVNVSINGQLHQIQLRPRDPQDIFDPAYAELDDFPSLAELPAGQTTFRIVADTPRGPGGVVIPGTPIWGFVSVTNNETQQITTITPN